MSDETEVLDLSDVAVKRRLMSKVSSLQGLYEVTLKPRKKTRSLNANRYYFQCVVTPFMHWLREAEGDPSIDREQAHVALKGAVLGVRTVTNRQTGEAVEIPPASRTMKSNEFANYIEGAAKFLAEFACIVVLTPEQFHGSKP